jgi:hypothetical protein
MLSRDRLRFLSQTVIPEVKFTFFLFRLLRLLTNLGAKSLCRQKDE